MVCWSFDLSLDFKGLNQCTRKFTRKFCSYAFRSLQTIPHKDKEIIGKLVFVWEVGKDKRSSGAYARLPFSAASPRRDREDLPFPIRPLAPCTHPDNIRAEVRLDTWWWWLLLQQRRRRCKRRPRLGLAKSQEATRSTVGAGRTIKSRVGGSRVRGWGEEDGRRRRTSPSSPYLTPTDR